MNGALPGAARHHHGTIIAKRTERPIEQVGVAEDDHIETRLARDVLRHLLIARSPVILERRPHRVGQARTLGNRRPDPGQLRQHALHAPPRAPNRGAVVADRDDLLIGHRCADGRAARGVSSCLPRRRMDRRSVTSSRQMPRRSPRIRARSHAGACTSPSSRSIRNCCQVVLVSNNRSSGPISDGSTPPAAATNFAPVPSSAMLSTIG